MNPYCYCGSQQIKDIDRIDDSPSYFAEQNNPPNHSSHENHNNNLIGFEYKGDIIEVFDLGASRAVLGLS